ncbi:phosphatidylinositol N-acetylglucosaminyltransferase subunit gpi1 [Xylographa soralifera]|nr:phosphatidylinositol N-acetylglucosaminyltransferase subunit gpi1 [Xylographa soralifera]
MVGGNGLLRIFWPSDVPRNNRPGTIVGWRNSELDFFVVSVLQDVEARNVENALRLGTLFRNSPHPVDRLFQLCEKSTMNVLGIANPHVKPSSFDQLQLHAFIDPVTGFPQIYCPSEHKLSVQIIVFDRPFPRGMQYMSLDPISLALSDTSRMTPPYLADQDDKPRSYLVQKLRLHTVVHRSSSVKELVLPVILSQINCSMELSMLLVKNINLIGARQKRSLSVSERVVESANTLWEYIIMAIWHGLTVWIFPILTRVFIIGLICHRGIAEAILQVLDWRIRPDAAALKDVSATAQQVDIRLQQFCYWPIQYTTLRRRRDDWDSVTDRHPDYIRFYNSLWLVANDVIIGIALGSYIIDNADWVAESINSFLTNWTVQGLQRMIVWLTDWPAGLKLNNELASFLGDLFLWVIDYWSQCVDNFRPFLPQIIYFIGFSSFAGASMPIALFSDLLSLLTVHITAFYLASARIYHWQWTILISLFHLFRGKKHNVLRNRIDSCDYDLDQLLLGTILFTLLVFLLPTVLVFYLTFASARMAIIFLKAALDTLLACLNHFPLFALMLRVKDSRRGICFELRDTPFSLSSPLNVDETPPVSYVALKSVPLSLRATFDQYFQLAERIRQHYLSARVGLHLATGRFVPPIHRKNLYSLQYSMLPLRRYEISEVWKRLTETRVSSSNGTMKIPNGTHLRRTYR